MRLGLLLLGASSSVIAALIPHGKPEERNSPFQPQAAIGATRCMVGSIKPYSGEADSRSSTLFVLPLHIGKSG
jgi:hypothetical protein